MNAFSPQKIRHTPIWLPETTALRHVPKHWHEWLTNTESLTKKLSLAYAAELKVNVLEQDWGVPDATELEALGMSEHGKTLTHKNHYVIRRVQLTLNGIARVYARSIFPKNCLTLGEKNIHQLGETPLGKWLFTHPELIRNPFEITQIKAELLPSDAGAPTEKSLWGRRSIFSLNNHNPMLVTEYFLTEMPIATLHQTARLVRTSKEKNLLP